LLNNRATIWFDARFKFAGDASRENALGAIIEESAHAFISRTGGALRPSREGVAFRRGAHPPTSSGDRRSLSRVVLPPRSRDESQTTRDHSRAEPATAPASWSCNGNPWQIALLGWNSATGLGVDAAKLATVAHERAKVLYGAGGLRSDCTDSGSLSHQTDDLHDREQ
jgi:hypothetical protein